MCNRSTELKLFKLVKCLTAASCLAALGVGISGCFSGLPDPSLNNPSLNPLASNQAGTLDGRWTDANGITSSFNNGIFETRSADTNEKLAEGNYVLRANNMIEMEMRSLVRGTVSHLNCSLTDASHLLCTAENGAQFTLTKNSL